MEAFQNAVSWRTAPERAQRNDGEGALRYVRYQDLLPKNLATALVLRLGRSPGRGIADIQRGLALRIVRQQLAVRADTEQVLDYVEQVGVDVLMEEGAAVAPGPRKANMSA